ncbi:MAG TPA: CoA ester lyase [Ramlibacter sp.]|uniref:HpcH/HpaI aldolase/citrate lyase family protein n=1 Tax=Ramlibacter sp. TaxID=1917967 RepID=UPI002CA99121|nr:CoA ester lyase [Ramlibacter sp.]HVZ42213.1 CoA ester lyase [Ramlibacter sp.]
MTMNSTQHRLARARSFLFVPGTRPERFGKALDSAADCVIVDLEDAVAPDEKAAARNRLADRFAAFTAEQLARTLVRVNGADTPWHAEDLRLLGEWTRRGLAAVVVPKAGHADALQAIGNALGPRALLLPLIESLAGLDAVDALSRAPQVARLAFGHLDFQLDLGMRCEPDETELASVRFALVAASRRAALPAPVDGVTVTTTDEARLATDVRRARAFGFGAKLCIHPSQVTAVNTAFSPSAQEVEWARRVIAGAEVHGGAAFSLDGRMVDAPVVQLARRTLHAAGLPEVEGLLSNS